MSQNPNVVQDRFGAVAEVSIELPPELFLGEGMVAGGREAEAQLLLRQAVLVPHVKLLEGLAQHVLQEDHATSFTNIHRTSS